MGTLGRRATGALVVLMAASRGAHAQPAPVPREAAPPRHWVAPKPKTPVPSLPDAEVRLSLDAPTPRGEWTIRMTNDGSVPVRVVADGRLLGLDVTPRGARKPERCELPPDMRPGDDLDRGLVLPPGRAYVETFEPRLYCFGKKLEALAPGAVVVAHLGWTKRGTNAPFELSPIDGVEPQVAPRKALDAPPVALPDEPTPPVVPAPLRQDAGLDAPRLSLRSSGAVEAEAPNDIELAVTLSNEGTRPVIVRFRPEAFAFDVTGPAGAEHCAWPRLPTAPTRELFTTLASKGTTTLNVMLAAYCSGHSLDQGGLLAVRAQLDTRNASGQGVGLSTFDGVVLATAPTLVRLRRGLAPEPHIRPKVQEP
jgi:hypothetical protein